VAVAVVLEIPEVTQVQVAAVQADTLTQLLQQEQQIQVAAAEAKVKDLHQRKQVVQEL
jgi:hypothetical protein